MVEEKMSNLHSFGLALRSEDVDLTSFITSLIEQNAELAERLAHLDSLTELAEKRVIEAGKEAEAIKAAAESEANSRAAAIVAGAEGSTSIAGADQILEDSAAEVPKEAGGGARLLRKWAERLLTPRKHTAQSLADVSQELCDKLDGDEAMKSAYMEGNDKALGAFEPDTAPRAQVDVSAEEPVQDSLCTEQELDEQESPASYGEFVDIVLPPPIALFRMLELYKQLRRNPGVRVVGVKGSLDKGLWLRFIVLDDAPLQSVFDALDEADRLSYSVIEVGKVFSAQK
jgi:hypothetical protein